MSTNKLLAVALGGFLVVVCGMTIAQSPGPDPVPVTPIPPAADPQPPVADPNLTAPEVGVVAPQPPTPSGFHPHMPAVASQKPQPGGTPSGLTAPLPPAQMRPEAMTIDQLLDAVDQVRAQKAELEKRERELIAVLRKKAEALKVRLDKLEGSPKRESNKLPEVKAGELPAVPPGNDPLVPSVLPPNK